MAYDPNDPADVAIVTAAVEAERERLTEEHDNDVTGLRNKVTELNGKLRKARAGGDDALTGEVERLEAELATAQGDLRTAQSQLRTANRDLAARTTERDTAVTLAATESAAARDLVVGSALTRELTAANVAPHFVDDVAASLAKGVTVKEVNGERQAFVGDVALGDYIKNTWSQGDKAKHYIVAPGNAGGGGGNPGNPSGGAKQIWQMNQAERTAAAVADPAGFQARVDAGEAVKPADAK